MNCGKYMFPSYRQAAEVANRQNNRRRHHGRSTNKVSVYHCPMCGSHHVTGFNN